MRGGDAVATAEAVRNGETDVHTLATEAVARIERLGPALNAVVHTRFEAALDEVAAGLPDGPLHGVPMLVKDLGTEVAGLPATGGSRLSAPGRTRSARGPHAPRPCCANGWATWSPRPPPPTGRTTSPAPRAS
ncbi:amidase family protein [Streptomyces halstedii]|uniref:amidase family protein n=1 Tax=Streptomyces TaxID=1883 RepID=UPI0004A8F9E6|nr:amidase family protein [Streptomyces sp. NTK 937]KDQ70957.1 hypothetical protein DT87_28250 [Streptomyces sp. NTK 937]WSX34639.1 amidase family protein [Streptomyces halstedii]